VKLTTIKALLLSLIFVIAISAVIGILLRVFFPECAKYGGFLIPFLMGGLTVVLVKIFSGFIGKIEKK
jgi:hypothetical protein